MGLGRGSFAIGLALLVSAAPLAAQSTNTVAPATAKSATPANQPPVVGPRELQNFSLGGTVTRSAEPTTNTATAPATAAPASRASAPSVVRAPASDVGSRTSTAAPATARRPLAKPATSAQLNDPSLAVTPAGPEPVAPQATPSLAPVPLPGQPASPTWPWLLAAFALAGVGGFLWWRRRPALAQPAYAGVSEALFVPEPESAPVPTPRMPVPSAPAPTPVPPPKPAGAPVGGGPLVGGGIIARSLEPKLALDFTPLRAEYLPGGEAALLFELVVVNVGSAPARQVLVEAKLLNAGPNLDQEVAQFFAAPVALGDRIPVILPQARISVRSRVLMTADRLEPVELDGRQLLVPVIAFNALYKSSGSGDRQDSASFLVGRGGEDGGKMGPLPIDRGPRAWDGLGARAHSGGLSR